MKKQGTAYNQARYQKTKEVRLAAAKIKYAANKEYFKLYARKRRLRTNYFPHLTLEEAYKAYQDMAEAQNHLCAICEKPESKVDPQLGKPCVLAVDHNHVTGEVRGLLCFRCNTNLGWVEAMGPKFYAYLNKKEII